MSGARCINHFVCGEMALPAGRTDFCVPCIALLSATKLARPSPRTGPCVICASEGEELELALFPACNTHSACVACVRAHLLGACKADMSAAETIDFVTNEAVKLLHQQRCPFCNLATPDSPAKRYRRMRAAGNGSQSNALCVWVTAGLEFEIAALKHARRNGAA